MKVLFLALPNLNDPWIDDVARAIGPEHELVLYDADGDVAEQFRDVKVVVDQGGKVATPALYDAGADAGVVLWQVLGTGVDHVDIPAATSRGLLMANTPGPFSAVALAEHAMFLMLYLVKRFDESLANLRQGTFYLPVTDHLEDRTLGLVGLGASGRELARRARAFGMRCRAVDPVQPGGDVLAELGIEAFGSPQDIDALLAESDFVSLHLPLVEDTYHLIGRRELGLMRPSAYLINVARGPLVDEEALVDALREGRLAGAGIDAFSVEPIDPEGPLLSLPNVVATPHIAGVTSGTSVRRASAVAENVRRVAAGLAPLYELAAPSRRD